MSLWNFTKNIGRNLFTNEKKAGENIQAHIEASNPGVEQLEITFDNGVAYVSGRFEDRTALEKTILMAGNVKGVERVEMKKVAFKAAKIAPPAPSPLETADALATPNSLDDLTVTSTETVTPAASGYASDIIQSEPIPADEITHYVTDDGFVEVNNPSDLEDPTVSYYEIQSGDSLSKIAKNFYGDAMKYKELFAANREVIEDPDKIYPGQKIRIPSIV